MKTPQELNDDYQTYVEDAVIQLDHFFNEKIIEMKRKSSNSKIFTMFFPDPLLKNKIYETEYKMLSYLKDENIYKSFIESCGLFGWNVIIDIKSISDKDNISKIIFTEKYVLPSRIKNII